MTPEQFREQVRELADTKCRNKHRGYYNSLICVGPNPSGFGPPCNDCLEETRKELEQKQQKSHGTELSPEQVEKIRRRLGMEN